MHWSTGQEFVFLPKGDGLLVMPVPELNQLREIGEERADSVIACTQKCIVAPLETDIALLAAECQRKFKLATADAIVYEAAQHCRAELI